MCHKYGTLFSALFGRPGVLQNLVGVVVRDLGIVAEVLVIRRFQQLLAPVAQLLPDRLLHPRVVRSRCPAGSFAISFTIMYA